ncbi:MAG: hypothetical protein VX156_06725 [Pseudomonadota bacterium]|nr:hypothetical protein [Pseudomonadota bacterium]
MDQCLCAHPDIREAATIGVPDKVYGEKPVSFASLRPKAKASEADILAHCANLLANFKMPSELILIDDVPKNNRGKVDRKSLAELWEKNYSSD